MLTIASNQLLNEPLTQDTRTRIGDRQLPIGDHRLPIDDPSLLSNDSRILLKSYPQKSLIL